MQQANQLTINVISFNKASSITKDINTTLIPIKNCIAPKKEKNQHYEVILIHCTILHMYVVARTVHLSDLKQRTYVLLL